MRYNNSIPAIIKESINSIALWAQTKIRDKEMTDLVSNPQGSYSSQNGSVSHLMTQPRRARSWLSSVL